MIKPNRPRQAFTLIEVLIVVIIMAVLAGAIIPQFSESTKDAKLSALDHNLHVLRNQIEAYKIQHAEKYPIEAGFAMQLTSATDEDGLLRAGSKTYGPYLQEIPNNPFTDTNTVVNADLGGAEPTVANVTAEGGWIYDGNTGEIWPNNSEYYE